MRKFPMSKQTALGYARIKNKKIVSLLTMKHPKYGLMANFNPITHKCSKNCSYCFILTDNEYRLSNNGIITHS